MGPRLSKQKVLTPDCVQPNKKKSKKNKKHKKSRHPSDPQTESLNVDSLPSLNAHALRISDNIRPASNPKDNDACLSVVTNNNEEEVDLPSLKSTTDIMETTKRIDPETDSITEAPDLMVDFEVTPPHSSTNIITKTPYFEDDDVKSESNARTTASEISKQTNAETPPVLMPSQKLRSMSELKLLRGRSFSQRIMSSKMRVDSFNDESESGLNRLSELNLMMKNVASVKLSLLQLKRLLSDDCVKLEDLADLHQSITSSGLETQETSSSDPASNQHPVPQSANPTRTTGSFFARETCYLDNYRFPRDEVYNKLKQVSTENMCLLSILSKKDAKISELEAKLKAQEDKSTSSEP